MTGTPVNYGDTIEITNNKYQLSFEVGKQFKVKRIIPMFNAVEEFDSFGMSIWILPEDYKIL